VLDIVPMLPCEEFNLDSGYWMGRCARLVQSLNVHSEYGWSLIFTQVHTVHCLSC